MLKQVITFLGWALSSLLIWVGTVALIQEKMPVMIAVVIISWGILCLPPLFTLTKKYGWMWNFCVRLMLFILIPVVLSPFISTEDLSTSMENLETFRPTTSPTVVTSRSPSPNPSVSTSAAPSPLSGSPLPILQPLDLQNSQTYVVAEATSLMSFHSPTDVVADLKQMKIIPKGGIFRVIEVFRKSDVPWYKVMAYDDEKKPMGMGWINSVTLAASSPLAAQPTPTLTVNPAVNPSVLPSPSVTVLAPSPSLNTSKPLASTPSPKLVLSPKPASSKPVSSPSPSPASKSRWPSHRVLTEAIAGGGSRIMIETDDATVSREQCLALVNKYLAQAKGNGQVIVYKPNAKPPWNGRVLAFCLNDLDNKGTRINDVYDW